MSNQNPQSYVPQGSWLEQRLADINKNASVTSDYYAHGRQNKLRYLVQGLIPGARENDNQYYQSLINAAKQKSITGAFEAQKNLNEVNDFQNFSDAIAGSVREDVKRKNLPEEAMNLFYNNPLGTFQGDNYQQPQARGFSKEHAEYLLKGLYGDPATNSFTDRLKHVVNNQYQVPQGVAAPPVQSTPEGQTQLSTGTEKTQPAQGLFFNPYAEQMMTGITSAGNNALGEGEKRYQFDQEAPKRDAETNKLMAEMQKALAEKDHAKAQALLTQIQTKSEAAYRQAQIGALNRSGKTAGRAPNAIDLMTPEQKAQYAARISQGDPTQSAPTATTIEALDGLRAKANDAGTPEEQQYFVNLYNDLAKAHGNHLIQRHVGPAAPVGAIPSFNQAMGRK